jgi:hypothetical protein
MSDQTNTLLWLAAFIGIFVVIPVACFPLPKPTLIPEARIIPACQEVCTNSDAYDNDMVIVQSCNEILKHYNGKGCFEDEPVE